MLEVGLNGVILGHSLESQGLPNFSSIYDIITLNQPKKVHLDQFSLIAPQKPQLVDQKWLISPKISNFKEILMFGISLEKTERRVQI